MDARWYALLTCIRISGQVPAQELEAAPQAEPAIKRAAASVCILAITFFTTGDRRQLGGGLDAALRVRPAGLVWRHDFQQL